MKITLQATTGGDVRDASSYKDRRSFDVELTRKRASELLDKCEALFDFERPDESL